MWRVLPARIAKFRRLQPVRMLLPVLHRRVISVFAFAALQCDDFAHNLSVPRSQSYLSGFSNQNVNCDDEFPSDP